MITPCHVVSEQGIPLHTSLGGLYCLLPSVLPFLTSQSSRNIQNTKNVAPPQNEFHTSNEPSTLQGNFVFCIICPPPSPSLGNCPFPKAYQSHRSYQISHDPIYIFFPAVIILPKCEHLTKTRTTRSFLRTYSERTSGQMM